MTTAREIITSALSFRLNRLSPGEALDADLAAMCLSALNDIADEWSGSGSFLWRTQLSSATFSGASATLGTTWADITPGQNIMGATYNAGAGDFPLDKLTMEQYQEQIRIKSLQGGLPQYFAQDGLSTVYFYPVVSASTPITLRVMQSVQEFADLDTDYSMPQGYRSGFADVLAERVAPSVLGAVPPSIAKGAALARNRLMAQSIEPAIISGKPVQGNVYSGWR